MLHLHHEFDLTDGELVEVTIDNPANVQLLDPDNFAAYKAGRPFNYHGGHYTQSPCELPAPHAGHWHLVVDLGGGPGRVRASVRVLPPAVAA